MQCVQSLIAVPNPIAMTYTKEQLQQLKEYAESLMTVDECAILMGIDRFQLHEDVNDPANPAYIYKQTMVEQALELRRTEMELARAGSPAAVEHALQLIDIMTDRLK